MKHTILVTGGAGYIGSHTAWLLYQRGYQVVVLDAFFHNQIFYPEWAVVIKGSIQDKKILESIFSTYDIAGVMHFAASIEVSESCKNPSLYYQNNVVNSHVLLDVARYYRISFFIFSSSCAVYGNPLTDVLAEDHPKFPISPYGKTKLIIEQMLEDYEKAYDIKFAILRYFNAAGSAFEYNLYEQHVPESHLIPLLLNAAIHEKPFSIFGSDYQTPDGTAIRDYVHVLDIADAHVKAFEYLYDNRKSNIFNLGTGFGYSVQQICNQVQTILQKKISVTYQERRAGDPKKLVADSSKITQILGWKPVNSSLENIITSAYHGLIKKNKNLSIDQNNAIIAHM